MLCKPQRLAERRRAKWLEAVYSSVRGWRYSLLSRESVSSTFKVRAKINDLSWTQRKKLPFRNKFMSKVITDPYHIFEGFIWAETQPQIHTIVIDSLSF